MTKSAELFPAEEELANLIWQNAPLSSPELVLLAQREIGWKKSTTYTVLKKLCNKGIFKNDCANVSVILTRKEFAAVQSRSFEENTFGGSLPGFVAAFISGRGLSPKVALELKQLIDEHNGDDHG